MNANTFYCQRSIPSPDPHPVEFIDTLKKVMPADSKEFRVDVRILDENKLNIYRDDPDFNYGNTTKEAEDWISKIKNWINQQLLIMQSSKTYSTILDIFYYGLAVLALILIVRGLIKADRRGLLFGNVRANQIKITETDEDIHQLNFDELISKAITNKSYKLAIRYHFLKSLKMLADKELIQLKNNKTNFEYFMEIKNRIIAEAFRDVIFRFEWIWYGDFPIDEQLLRTSQKDFDKLFALVNA
jgi:hypothetical protein